MVLLPGTPLPDGKMWLTTREVAAHFGVDRRTVDGMRRRGELRAYTHGNGEKYRSWRYRREDVLRYWNEPNVAQPETPTVSQRAAYHQARAALYEQLRQLEEAAARECAAVAKVE